MIVRTSSGRPDPYAGMGRMRGLGEDGFDFQGEGDVGTSLSIDPEMYPTNSLPQGVFSVDNSSGEFSGWSTGASAGSMLPNGTGVTQDANGNWLDASGKLTNFNTSGSSPGSQGYNPGVFSNLFSALAITTPSIVAAVNGVPVANVAQCQAAGGSWTGTSCVKQTTNTSTMLMWGVGLLGVVLLISAKGRR